MGLQDEIQLCSYCGETLPELTSEMADHLADHSQPIPAESPEVPT